MRRTISSPKERASNTPADDGAFTATLLPWAVVAQKSFAEHSSTSKKDDEVPVILSASRTNTNCENAPERKSPTLTAYVAIPEPKV